MMASLTRKRVRHSYDAPISEGIDIIFDLLRSDVLCNFATPHQVNRHIVGRLKDVMMRNRRDSAINIRSQAVNTVRYNTQALEKPHSMAFAASNIEHRIDRKTVHQVSPKNRTKGGIVAVVNVPPEVRACFITNSKIGHFYTPITSR